MLHLQLRPERKNISPNFITTRQRLWQSVTQAMTGILIFGPTPIVQCLQHYSKETTPTPQETKQACTVAPKQKPSE